MARGDMNARALSLQRKLTPGSIWGCGVAHRVPWVFDLRLNRAPCVKSAVGFKSLFILTGENFIRITLCRDVRKNTQREIGKCD